MRKFLAGAKLLASAAATLLTGASAHAAQPAPWEMSFQPAATDMMRQIAWFEGYTLWFIVPITLFVLFLIAYCILKFRASVNPTPSRTSHNTLIEVIWTVGPVVVLLLLAIPSFQLLTAQYTPPEEAKLTVKATGNQWNWDYEYQTENTLSFNSAILADADRAAAGKEDRGAYPRLLAVDNEMVVPVNTMTRVLVTAADVIHAFAMPSFGIKTDAVPGRINEVWFKAEKEGLYYGQCSELCGKDHAFMPIAIRVVSDAQYKTWLAAAGTDLPGANKALMAEVDGKDKVAAAGN
ncbi:cytochrome c oxidase subunit II [Mesorhizobium sp.]|uniref:cytochrome c oxidase subunit II n=1 Tax=Mesorhizobium sp. TaxID=1871066 RepID=UPI000FE30F38|nr:cytochrome c oxidase subunit II [Mesorhizobium sp.]RWN58222.1 MAG: cytochrome c oxidase subunit II [Mesorhizobium sp.]RWN79226.1 MAG: cytochrome c oxidase subunit II [Mesorhizobium sp.]RWN84783.1 MAG: cytochrome c oxidase subunit II [Mesorhizobium sp.]RWN92902.1 MAG: cytochrome c oxidase subunit II [Mesorhizobium sp.]RWO17296.1 MAG: cytochrome c oxidase subunit II [Mesorhizobium sp.]